MNISMSRLLSLGLLIAAGGTAAHAAAPLHLVSSQPAARAITEWPKQIVLHFDQPLRAGAASMDILKPDGTVIALEAPLETPDGKGVSAGVKLPLLGGAYMVRWSVVSAQGQALKGDYTFQVPY